MLSLRFIASHQQPVDDLFDHVTVPILAQAVETSLAAYCPKYLIGLSQIYEIFVNTVFLHILPRKCCTGKMTSDRLVSQGPAASNLTSGGVRDVADGHLSYCVLLTTATAVCHEAREEWRGVGFTTMNSVEVETFTSVRLPTRS